MYQDSSGFGGLGGLGGLIAIMVVLFTLGGGGNFFGNNGNQNTIEIIKGQQSLQNNMNNNALTEIANANANNISQLMTANNNNISQLQANHSSELAQMGGFANISNQIGQQTAALQLMGATLGAQQQQCCCETQKELIQIAGDNKLTVCSQTNEIENNIVNTSNLLRSDIQQLNYNINNSTAAIIAANNAGVQRIIDFETNSKIQDLQQKLADAKGELSQNQQTLILTNQLNNIYQAISKIPTTATAGA